MSLIADALKRAQEERAAGRNDDKARRLLTASGPLRVETGDRARITGPLAIAGTVLAAAVATFGLIVVLSPRTEIAPAAAFAREPDEPGAPAQAYVQDVPPLTEADLEPASSWTVETSWVEPGVSRPVPTFDGARDRDPAPVGGRDRVEPAARAGPSSFSLRVAASPGPTDLFGRALGAQQRGDLESAAALYRRAIESNPADAQFHNNLGAVYRALSMPGQALASFQAAVDVDAGYAPAWSNLGMMLDGLGRDAEAIAAFQQALVADPSNTGAKVNLANKYQGMGLLEPARTLLSEVLRDDPTLPEAHYGMGRVLESSGDRAGAVRHYTLFLNLGRGRFPELEGRVREHLPSLGGTDAGA